MRQVPCALLGLGLLACDRLIGLDHAYADDSSASDSPFGDEFNRGDAGGPFCEARSLFFCRDFDKASAPDDGWSFHTQIGFSQGGAFDLDRSTFTSRPASLRMGVPAGVPGVDPGYVNRVGWEPTAVSPVTSAHAECDVRLNGLDDTASTYLIELIFNEGNESYYVDILSSSTSAVVQEVVASGSTTTPLKAPLAQQVWMHIELDVAFGSPSLVVKVDGREMLTKALSAGYRTGFQQISLGPRYYVAGSVKGADMNFDNVAVEVTR